MLLLEWMVRAAVLGALVSGAAWALEQVVRAGKGATRFVWVGALVVTLVLPLVAMLAPDMWPESWKRPGAVVGLPVAEPGEFARMSSRAVERASPVGGRERTPWSARDVVAVLWISASLLLALRWLYGWQKLRTVCARSREALVAGERVLVSDRFGPAVVGLMHPRVIVPAWLAAGAVERQRMIVRHEVEHTSAGDPWLLALAPILVVLFPWNPALWWQLQRLRLAIELDCDARVLRGGVSALEYGTMLLDVAGGATLAHPNLAALAEPRTSLERRILAMTPIRYRYGLVRALSLIVISVLALAGAVLAGAPAAAPAVAQERRPSPEQQEGTPLLVVDGKLLSSGAQLDLAHLEIAKVEVLTSADAVKKFGTRGRLGAVIITTQRSSEKARADIAVAELTQARAAELELSNAELRKVITEKEKADIELQRAKLEELEAISLRGTITGYAIIDETGQPAVAAQVTIGNRGAITDATGRFVIRNVPAGDRTLHVRMPGYTGSQQIVVAPEAASNVETIRLRAMTAEERIKFDRVKSDDEVKIIHAFGQLDQGAHVKVTEKVQARELAELDKAAKHYADVKAALKPEVEWVTGEKVSVDKMRVREPGGPLVLVNGVIVGSGNEVLELVGKLIVPADIEGVEVIKGAAAAALYGERGAAGVIQIKTRKR
jgi:TonB-dependent SusC/RagA subfamily outer membrane receptor